MTTASTATLASRALERGGGILHLAPTWVPRSFGIPGRRLKLHADDVYALGGHRGGLVERWLASTIPADNGPDAAPNEGLSFVVVADERLLLRDAVAELKGELIGERLWNELGEFGMFAKFFDYMNPLPFHMHQQEHHAQLVGQHAKPEAYYFSPQLNSHGGDLPYTFFGLEPHTTKDQIRDCLRNFGKGDNHITDLSKAYRLVPGTGWDVPAGLLHGPGSMCTYEPQKSSDVFAMYQSLCGDAIISEDLLYRSVPPERYGDVEFMIEVLDWEANIDPHLIAKRHMVPLPVAGTEGYTESWVCYKSPDFSAKELTVPPGRTVTVKDAAAYGLVCVQGHGTIGGLPIDTPHLIRFGQLTADEYFVSEAAARAGVKIVNPSAYEPIVMLKAFGPQNPDLPS